MAAAAAAVAGGCLLLGGLAGAVAPGVPMPTASSVISRLQALILRNKGGQLLKSAVGGSSISSTTFLRRDLSR